MRTSASGDSGPAAAADPPPTKQCVSPAAQASAAQSAAPHARGGRRAKGAGGGGGWLEAWVLPIGALVLWFVSSSAIIIVNKRLLVDEGFAYPLTLTGLSQFVSAFGGAARVLACPAMFHDAYLHFLDYTCVFFIALDLPVNARLRQERAAT